MNNEKLDTPINSNPKKSNTSVFEGDSLWAAVTKTDPSMTKGYKGAGGFAGTAINTLYPVMRATEIFGPAGTGWGYEIIEEKLVTGGPIITGEGETIGNEQTHIIKIQIWANINDTKATIEHYGCTPFIYTNKYGVQTDHEAPKKSLSDAIKKALTIWGFSADVFMGQYDDPEYVKAQEEQEAMAKADDKQAEAISQAKEYDTWKADNVKLIKN